MRQLTIIDSSICGLTLNRSIDSYREHRSSVSSSPIAPTHLKSSKNSSCGLRLYETSTSKFWKATRRLIITSAPEELEPTCISHCRSQCLILKCPPADRKGLPLAHVRVSVDGATLTMSWSDYAHLEMVMLSCHGPLRFDANIYVSDKKRSVTIAA